MNVKVEKGEIRNSYGHTDQLISGTSQDSRLKTALEEYCNSPFHSKGKASISRSPCELLAQQGMVILRPYQQKKKAYK